MKGLVLIIVTLLGLLATIGNGLHNSSSVNLVKTRFQQLVHDLVYSDERNLGIELTESILFKAIQSEGSSSILSTMMVKLENRQCLSILSIGGSVCSGYNIENDQQSYPDRAFPAVLVRYLNDMFPCDQPSGHVQNNECIRANGSNTFIDLLLRTLHVLEELKSNQQQRSDIQQMSKFDKNAIEADVILVDTAFNDVLVQTTNFKSDSARISVQKSMELLLRLLYRLPKFPAIIYVAATVHPNIRLWKDRLTQAEDIESQVEVARYYQIPFVSVLTALGPFDTTAKQNYLSTKYLNANDHHPSAYGHTFFATLLAYFIYMNQFGNGYPVSMCAEGASGEDIDKANVIVPDHRLPSKLLVLSEDDLQLYINSAPSYIDLNMPESHQQRGYKWTVTPPDSWSFKSEGRPTGFISEMIGSSYLLEVPKSTLMTTKALHISLLKSYENMGRLHVRMYVGDVTLGEATIDCQWGDHTSRAISIPIPLNTPATELSSNPFIELTITASDPPRSTNKVKVYYILIM